MKSKCYVFLMISFALLASQASGNGLRVPDNKIQEILHAAESENRLTTDELRSKNVYRSYQTSVTLSETRKPLDQNCDGIQERRNEWNAYLRELGEPDLGPIYPKISTVEKKTKRVETFLEISDTDQTSYIDRVSVINGTVVVRVITLAKHNERKGAVYETIQESKYPPASGGVGVFSNVITGGVFAILSKSARQDLGCTTKELIKDYINYSESTITKRFGVAEIDKEHVIKIIGLGEPIVITARPESDGVFAKVKLSNEQLLSTPKEGITKLTVTCETCASAGAYAALAASLPPSSIDSEISFAWRRKEAERDSVALLFTPKLSSSDLYYLDSVGLTDLNDVKGTLARIGSSGYSQSYDFATLKQFLNDERQASSVIGKTAINIRDERLAVAERERREAERLRLEEERRNAIAAAERARLTEQRAAKERAELARKYPYTATFSCGLPSIPSYPLGVCFTGDYANTALMIKSGRDYPPGKSFQWYELNSIGEYTYDGTKIMLRDSFNIVAQNASKTFALTLVIRETASGKIIYRQSAQRFGGVIRATR